MENKFKLRSTFEKRKEESDSIKKKYSDRIPIIVQKHSQSTLNDVDKCKYLVPKDMSMGQFLFVVRKRIKLSPEQALFIYVNNSILPQSSALLTSVYNEFQDEDGFLYITYSGENTFG